MRRGLSTSARLAGPVWPTTGCGPPSDASVDVTVSCAEASVDEREGYLELPARRLPGRAPGEAAADRRADQPGPGHGGHLDPLSKAGSVTKRPVPRVSNGDTPRIDVSLNDGPLRPWCLPLVAPNRAALRWTSEWYRLQLCVDVRRFGAVERNRGLQRVDPPASRGVGFYRLNDGAAHPSHSGAGLRGGVLYGVPAS